MDDLSLPIDKLYLEYLTSYHPPKKQRRIEEKLIAAGKLNFTRLTSVDKLTAKFEMEIHVLEKTVIVDDGSEKKVYSTCVFENTKRYDCNICITSVYGKTSLIRHNRSRKHYEMMQRKTHPHENFDDKRDMKIVRDVKECYFVKDLLEECRYLNINLVLIGLEYLVEVLDPRGPYYICLLCNKEGEEIEATINHLEGYEHRMLYMLLYFPKVYKKLSLLQKEIWQVQLNIVVQKIEKKLGRLKPWRHDGPLSLKQKKAIRYAIDKGPHLRDLGLSFSGDIVFNEDVKDPMMEHTVLTEFLVNETEDNKVFERVKGGGYRCKLCKTGVNSIVEKITHPYTGRHIGKTIKGMSILDNVACTIQNAIERYPQPLIGTEYIVEYDEQGVFLWYCMLCRKGMNNQDQVLLHLVSKQHRQWYIKHHMPVKHQELLKKTGPVKAEDTLRLLRQIEAKYPNRLPAFGCIYSLDHVIDSGLTIKDVISQKIMDGQHFTVNERGMPQMIYKMPVPLFSEEEQATPGTSSKKKKKKRSRSASSDRSLSPVARQRRLSPEPLELPDLPTEQLKEDLIFDWLASQPSTSQPSTSQPSTSQPSTSQPSTSQPRRRAYVLMGQVAITKESLEQFIAECDEDNWKSRSQCGCVAELTLTCPLRELLDDDEAFYEVRRVLIGAWMIRLNKDFGWNIQSLDITKDPKLYRLVEIMETGRFVLDVCRPLCRNCVESTAECTLEDFPQYKDIPIDELMDISRGLVNMSNLLHFFYVNIPKSAYTQSE